MWYPILGGMVGLLVSVVSDLFQTDWLLALLLGVMAGQILLQQKQLGQIKRQLNSQRQTEQAVPQTRESEDFPQPESVFVLNPEETKTEPDLSSLFCSASKETFVPRLQKQGLEPTSIDRGVQWFKQMLTRGNMVTKVGIVILFFGAAFLLKYASQRHLLPVEFRLMGVFTAGLVMLCTGWRLRSKKNAYSLLLQGGGIGILYLTIFTATRFYQLVPSGFSFALMLFLVIGSCLLALLQNAKALAITAIVGGFLAPILVSTGAGSHIALFTYYALLNFGIVLIALRRAWRELNVIGFYFTFVIGAAWGGKYYQPHYFASTEPFLVLFFLLYVTIAILYALRHPPRLKGFVDGTLVFALPVVFFGLQYGLVRNFRYGMAFSALLLGLFYGPVAIFLWRRYQQDLRLLSESFMAFAIVFGSLAIPLALDGRWTSAAWALEGAALLWLGIRQKRFCPRLFGILLQVGSGVAFLLGSNDHPSAMAVFNSFFSGCLLISVAGLFSSWHLRTPYPFLHRWEQQAGTALLFWGLLWWMSAVLLEIVHFVTPQYWPSSILLSLACSFILLNEMARFLRWTQLAYSGLGQLPVMFLILPGFWTWTGGESHLFAGCGFLAWLAAFAGSYRALYCCERIWPIVLVRFWHLMSGWLLLGVVCHEAWWLAAKRLALPFAWHMCTVPLVLGTVLVLLIRARSFLPWPLPRFPRSYSFYGVAGLIGFLCCWSLVINLYPADPKPLVYLPLLNPVELCQLGIALCLLYCTIGNRYWRLPRLRLLLYSASAGSLFLLLNAMLARTIHFYCQVPFTVRDLFHSDLLQAAISLLWGFLALAITVLATRRKSRPTWLIGTSILGLVVVKLFLVDLANIGTFTRIISFIGVGSLMLLIGYFSPLPPAEKPEEKIL